VTSSHEEEWFIFPPYFQGIQAVVTFLCYFHKGHGENT